MSKLVGRPVSNPGWLGQKCTWLKRVATPEDCLGCQRPRCVHDEPDGRGANKERPRSGGKAGALENAQA